MIAYITKKTAGEITLNKKLNAGADSSEMLVESCTQPTDIDLLPIQLTTRNNTIAEIN